MDRKTFVLLFFNLTLPVYLTEDSYCLSDNSCSEKSPPLMKLSRYILYEVNVGEGFNLKRDVYMRMAIFANKLAQTSKDDWHLVLPPWTKQWHWKNEKRHVSYLWKTFFDVESLQLYAPVIEIDQFYKDYGHSVDEVYILQHFPEFYEWKGDDTAIDWSDRWSFADCRDSSYWIQDDGTFLFFRGEKKVKAKQVYCISFQGSSEFLESVVSSTKAASIMFDRAEIPTHMMFGDSNYWMCRRSMRFAKHLINAASEFRAFYLNSSDEQDGTVMPLDWRDEQPYRSAKGGPYLGVHLRRQDFVEGRPTEVPSLIESVIQIKMQLNKLNLNTVFVATDMPPKEYNYIHNELHKDNIHSFRYHSLDGKESFNEGELAIIDQIIASHGKYFIGTHESTFSFRIQEEREIMGFPVETTFNRFCPSSKSKDCTPPTKWLIKYPNEEPKKNKNYKHSKTDEL